MCGCRTSAQMRRPQRQPPSRLDTTGAPCSASAASTAALQDVPTVHECALSAGALALQQFEVPDKLSAAAEEPAPAIPAWRCPQLIFVICEQQST